MFVFIKFQIFCIEISIGCNWTGTTDAETWKCCSSEMGSTCGIQEGHCSHDDECFWHLNCGTGNCPDQSPLSDFPLGSNCCYDPIPSKIKFFCPKQSMQCKEFSIEGAVVPGLLLCSKNKAKAQEQQRPLLKSL